MRGIAGVGAVDRGGRRAQATPSIFRVRDRVSRSKDVTKRRCRRLFHVLTTDLSDAKVHMPTDPLCSVSRLSDGVLPIIESIFTIVFLFLTLVEIRPALG